MSDINDWRFKISSVGGRKIQQTVCRYVCSHKHSKTEEEDISVSWESLHSYIKRNDLCRYEVSPKFLK